MKHHEDAQHIESAGTDSFLDVTTNIVGILIVLVLVIGMRVKHGPRIPPAEAAEVAAVRKQAAELDYEIRRIQQQAEAVEQEIAVRSAEREALAVMIAAAEKEITDRRAARDPAEQEEFDLQRQLDESGRAIEQHRGELADLATSKPPTQEVKHYPTPISRTVMGREVHFQLMGGRISHVPIEEFIDDVRSNMRSAGSNLRQLTDQVGVVGPRNGFEFRYTMDLVTDPSRGLVGVRTKEFQVVPVGVQHGETLEQALSNQSQLRNAIALHSPRDTTVTLWTYPDSFAQFRQLKEELSRIGFQVAGRPLPQGVLIGGSNRGTKSAAQ